MFVCVFGRLKWGWGVDVFELTWINGTTPQPVRIEEESPAKAQQAVAVSSLAAEVEAEAESKVAGLAARPEVRVHVCVYVWSYMT